MKNLPILLLITVLLGSLGAILGFQDGKQNELPMLTFNNDDYAAAWKTIDSLQAEGLPKSALEKVEALYQRAVKEDNPSQVIKTVIYRGKYTNQLQEEGLVKAIHLLKTEMEQATFPTKVILQSMLAEAYSNYLSNNYYRFNSRTATPEFQPKDIQTWSIQQITDEIKRYHLLAIENPKSKQTPIQNFEAITNKGRNTTGLRPTLHDFLVHRAIDFFSNDQAYLTDPAYKFYIDDQAAFAPADVFAKHQFTTKDEESLKYRTLLLLQNLVSTHLTSNNIPALVDADLKRLQFVYNNAVLGDKEKVYLQALDQLKMKYAKVPQLSEIIFKIASVHATKGNLYPSNQNPDLQFELKKALELCEEAINAFPESYGANQCRQLKSTIQYKNLRLQTESVLLPNEPFLSLVNYRNVDKIWLRVVQVDEALIKSLSSMRRNEKVAAFQKLDPLKNWSISLPNDQDFQAHSVEIKFDALGFGQYLILAADNADFTDRNHALNFHFVHVSNIASVNRKGKNNKTEFIVMHRKTGAPLANVQAEFFGREYNSRTRKNEYKKWGSGRTDENGFVSANVPDRKSFKVKYTLGEDVLDVGENFSNYSYGRNDQTQKITHFFLDRAIYRPGQIVYYKGIAIEKDKEQMPRILSNESVEVVFYDVNYQEVEKVKLRTNEYGTFNGTFTAPKTGLLGQMSLSSSIGGNRIYFRVEEYKRPRFEVKFDPVKESYRLDEEVKVQGFAKAFAGSNVDGAKVVYRVERTVSYPYFPWWRYSYRMPQGSSMEIANGETTTDEKGAFEIAFTALPDRSAKKEQQPQFSYRVHVDIVDITGETRSNTTSVNVGYVALKLNVDLPQLINRDSLKSLLIDSKNLNGEFAAAKGQITITALNDPGRSLKQRYWNKPDRFVMTKDAFYKDFPHDVYQEEDKIYNWREGKNQLSTTFDTEQDKTPSINTSNWPTGAYVLTLQTKDRYDTPVEIKKYFTLYDLDGSKLPSNLGFFHQIEKSVYQPGETAKIQIGSSFAPIKMLFEIEEDQSIVKREWLSVNSLQQLNLAILEKHWGNVHYHLSFVKENRVFLRGETISVPWNQKDLKVEYATFRDKLYPGQKEEWRIKISGNKSEKVAAEMLAGMYDASLDAFAKNNWQLNLFPFSYQSKGLRSGNFHSINSQMMANNWQKTFNFQGRQYSTLNWFGFPFYSTFNHYSVRLESESTMLSNAPMQSRTRSKKLSAAPPAEANMEMAEMAMMDGDVSAADAMSDDEMTGNEADKATNTKEETNKSDNNDLSDVKVRTNLKETVFFFPNLMTDEEGNIIIKFTMNEALTRWKFMGLAHTKDLKTAITEKEVVTQKDLMVIPNAPRFVREGDQIEFTAKVSNLTEKQLQGNASLQLFDALTMKPVDELLANQDANINFTAEAGQSARLAWNLTIPTGKVLALTHRIVAKAGNFSDGEESSLPVLTNRMMVTETQPLPLRGKESKDFEFTAMKKATASTTLQHHKLTLEFTSNPAWYAVQALPYLMDYPYQCTEQIFSRFYANSLASSVANKHPKIKRVFEAWKNTDALESNLSKNQELKSALLEETPWVLQAQSEAQQKRNIGLLFDLNKMSYEKEQALAVIAERQLSNGGFAWFPGGRDSWYITQYLVEGMGHLDKLGVNSLKEDSKISEVLTKAVRYIDDRIVEQYKKLEESVKEEKAKLEDDHLNSMAIHYLYARSFFADQEHNGESAKVRDYYLGQAEKYWLKKGIYQEGMIALALQRAGRLETPAKIVKSLKERSLNNEELGMYWKGAGGYFWYQLPIETHALMIEVFSEVAKDERAVDDLKVWLLKTKQTTHWKTTKATASAVYALLMNGDNWLLSEGKVKISFPQSSNTAWEKQFTAAQDAGEAGTGYFKSAIDGKEVNGNMSSIRVENPNNHPAWGAMYWQYFEDLDKIKTFEETPLTLSKKLFIEKASDRGPVMVAYENGTTLEPGDKLKVRIELRVDRPMEYVHMKDMRASSLEPINVLSRYKWQGGLGYYESTKDASTNFFFDYLPKGTHVFEYPLRVSHKGDFSNGITTIQCMYAPEFTSHSEGVRIQVD